MLKVKSNFLEILEEEGGTERGRQRGKRGREAAREVRGRRMRN
jgi:hypothetical protein